MAEVEAVNLDTLNPKQRAKEFKATQKDIKSKDLVVKNAALKKIGDIRYLTEGGSFVPLVNSIIPKKKTLDVSKLCIDHLLLFLGAKSTDQPVAPTVAALRLTLTTEGNLSVLKVLSDTFNFREEIKKPKKKKAKNTPVEEEEAIPEDPMYETLRRSSLKSFYQIVLALYAEPANAKDLQVAITKVDNLVQALCDLLLSLKPNITSEKVDARCKAVQDGIYALFIMVFVLRHNPEAVLVFLKSEVLTSLQKLSHEKRFTLYCIQILEILSWQKEGITALSGAPMQGLLIELLSSANQRLNEPAPDVAPANAKDKKKEPPKKGVPEVVEDPMDKLDAIVVDPNRGAVASITLVSKIYIAIGSQLNPSIDLSIAKDVATIVSKTLLNAVTYEVARSPLHAPLDEPLTDCVDTLCIVVGTLGAVSGEVRSVTYEAGALSASLTVLLNSQTIVAGPAPVVPAPGAKGAPAVEAAAPLSAEGLLKQKQRVMQLRRVSEKAVLNLVTESLESPLDDVLAGHVSHDIHLPVRWTSCFARKSDDAAFGAGDATLAAKLVDLVSVVNDEDLAGRGVRILAAVLHGHHHPVELIESKGLHKSLVKPLALLVQQRGLSLITTEMESDIRASAEKKALLVTALAAAAAAAAAASEAGETDFPVNDIIDALENVTIDASAEKDLVVAEKSVEPEPPASVDVLLPTVAETLFLALSVIELFLMTNPDTINAFTSIERVEVLSDLLRVLGPVSCSAASGVESKVVEFEAVLHDPRRHNWSSANPSSYSDSVLMRPLIFDVLSLIASAGLKYRTYEGELPAPPCEPVPPSVSPCEEAALVVCKLSADACCSVLLRQSVFQFTTTPSGTVLNVQPNPARMLVAPVQDAALSLLRSISNCGVRGVAGAIGGIAAAGFGYLNQAPFAVNLDAVDSVNFIEAGKKILVERSSTSDLGQLLLSVKNSSAIDTSAVSTLQQLIPAGYVWKRPVLFEEVFPSLEVVTLRDNILSNQQIWPFIVFAAAFMGTLANPATSQTAAALTLDALSAAVRLPVLDDHSQPVVTDAVSAAFLSLGGGVVLSGLLSRFGNLAADIKPAGDQLAFYLFNRGHRRESFWKEWELSNREEVILDPKTGKPIVKKDDKKKEKPAEKKKDPKAAAEAPSSVPDVELLFESTQEFVDPNHGPSAELWVKLINVGADDLHEQCPATTPLISLVQGGKSELAVFLINQGAQVNDIDGTGHTALMYGLLMNDEPVVSSLIAKQADFNLIDRERNPTMKYAILSLTPQDIDRHLVGYNSVPAYACPTIELLGGPTLLPTLLKSTMDFRVAGPHGLSPIMIALGLGDLTVLLGGHLVHIQNASYKCAEHSIEQVHLEVENLIAVGADVNFCNVAGAVPLHIAAAHGDLKLMESLLSHGAIPNAQDNAGFLPIHYLAACCPDDAIAGFDLLFKFSSHRHLERMVYNDYRTGVPQEEKERLDLEKFMTETFAESISPSVIRKKRLSPSEILHQCTDNNLNLLQLCFAAPVLLAKHAPLRGYFFGNKDKRMALALHIIQCAEKLDSSLTALINHTDTATGLTTLHAASLLFQGLTPQVYLTDREKRAKRVRKFVSSEARILDYIYAHIDSNVINATCTYPLQTPYLPEWTLMHPAVFWDNPELASSLLQKGFRLEDTEMVHFLAEFCPAASEALVRVIIDAASNSPRYKALLNDRGTIFAAARPLHTAVRCRSLSVVRALASSVKVDLNAVDDRSGRTALFEACELGALNLVQAFIPGADRLDLFAGSVIPTEASPNQDESAGAPVKVKTPLNVSLESLNIFILQELIFMRKNDVIQQLLQISTYGEGDAVTATTLLYSLEKDNCFMAEKLGIGLPPILDAMSSSQKVAALDAQAASKGISSKEAYGAEDIPQEPENVINEPEVEAAVTGAAAEDEREGGDSPAGAPPVQPEAPQEDLDVIEQSGIGGRVLKDKKNAAVVFNKSNEILRVVIDLVNGSGIVRESDHFHAYYFSGALIDI